MMTPAECRAARALLEWSQLQLAEASGADVAAIRDFETGRLPPAEANVAALKGTLQNAGVEFVSEIGGGSGVRLR
ncbi:transcriptional regulator [Aureimonas endophytica]|uniref:Transcriptional regulator n=1 Tax=Aureimonas endophytica TaxID=2027858 RepID=A0A916ZJV6_9HYPH|nr:transcriptional regulator [Aureimonas endophytica]